MSYAKHWLCLLLVIAVFSVIACGSSPDQTATGADVGWYTSTSDPPETINCRGCRLSNVDLTGKDLTGADLTGADLTGAYLTDAVLTSAYLDDADLHGANLRGAIGADVSGARNVPDEYRKN